jgi:uncharacterized Tic20 family protein
MTQPGEPSSQGAPQPAQPQPGQQPPQGQQPPPPQPQPVSYETRGLPSPGVQGYVVTEDDRLMGLLIHLGLILAAVMSLIIWLVKKDQSPFINHHGKQALSFFLAMLIASAIAAVLMFACVGFLLLPVLIVLNIVFPIIAAVAAYRGEWYRYPLVGGMIR